MKTDAKTLNKLLANGIICHNQEAIPLLSKAVHCKEGYQQSPLVNGSDGRQRLEGCGGASGPGSALTWVGDTDICSLENLWSCIFGVTQSLCGATLQKQFSEKSNQQGEDVCCTYSKLKISNLNINKKKYK